MTEFTAGWAVHSKPPGAHDDYRIVASSGWPLTATTFETAVLTYLPGPAPTGREGGADAYPWVVFSTFQLGDGSESFRGVAVTQWPGHVDHMSRPVVETRYGCVRADGAARVGLRALHDAFGQFSPPGANGSTRRGSSTPGSTPGPMPIEVDDPGTAARVEGVRAAGLERVAEAAAALLDKRVVVVPIGESVPPLGERLAFMDAVTAVLPAGAPWLVAASWWDHQAQIRRGTVHLTFSTRPGPDTYVLGRGPEGRLGREAQEYRALLLGLVQKFGVERVVEHLARIPAPKRPEPGDAVLALGDLDLGARILRDVRAKTLDLRLLRRFLRAGRCEELDSPDRRAVLEYAAPVVQAGELGDLDPLWQQSDYDLLLRLARERLGTVGWPPESLAPFVDVGRRIADEDCFLADLCRRTRGGWTTESLAAAADLVARVDPRRAGQQLREVVSTQPELALAVALHPDVPLVAAREWAAIGLSRPAAEAAPDYLGLEAVAFAVGRRVDVTSELLDAVLLIRGHPGLLAWFHLLRAARPADEARVLAEFLLPLLHQHESGTPEEAMNAWEEVLTSTGRGPDPVLEAEKDLLLCRWGRVPADLADVFWSASGRAWKPYVDTLWTRMCLLPPDRSETLVGVWADGLAPGWSEPPERCRVVLGLLWAVARRLSPDAPMSEEILRPVLKEVSRRPGWVHAEAYAPWVQEACRHPRLLPYVLESELAELPASSTVADVAAWCIRLFTGRRRDSAAQTLAALDRSKVRFDHYATAELCESILGNTAPADQKDVLDFVDLLLQERDGPQPGPYRGALALRVAERVVIAAQLLRVATSDPSLVSGELAEQLMRTLRPAMQDVEAVGESLAEHQRSGGRRWMPSWRSGRRPEEQ